MLTASISQDFQRPLLALHVGGVSDPAQLNGRVSQAVGEGFGAVEVTLTTADFAIADTTSTRWAELAGTVAACGARIDAVRLESPTTDIDRPATEPAAAITDAMDRVSRLGADTLIVPLDALGVHGDPPDYDLTYGVLLDLLLKLRFAAQTRAVRICVEMPDRRMFRSPMELRRFLDRVNSPWVGAGLLWGRAARLGGATPWASSLGWRIMALVIDDEAGALSLDVPVTQGSTMLECGRWAGLTVCRTFELGRIVRTMMMGRE